MKKISSLLAISLMLAACHTKPKPAAVTGDQPAAMNAAPPTPGLIEDKNDFKKPVYNTVPDHGTSFTDTAVPDLAIGGAVSYTYAASSATAFDAATSNGGVYTVQAASMGGFGVASDANNTAAAQRNVVTKTASEKAGSQIVKNATVMFQVKDADSSHGRLAGLLETYDAYTVIDKRTQDATGIQQKMQIRVPPAKFEKLIAEIMKESVYTDVKDISADDVSAQYVDMETRLRSKKEVERRYTELLNRATRLNDIIVIENNRRYIREEIESLEGNVRLLQDQVAFSTIYLTLVQKSKETPKPVEPEVAEASFGTRVKAALATGWSGIQLLALFLLNIWPVVLVGIPLSIWLVRKYKTQVLLEPVAADEE
ncbi:MAG: hypothetical protein JWO03_1051 [Bacteroidetes bacterium]|nr:hypothetical protein [Bacteroidota bacterium]